MSWSSTPPSTPSSTNRATSSVLAGDLERHGLIDAETLKRIACDATIVIALDDDVGHTMYEGRARRFPTRPSAERSCPRPNCRFPGCANVTFAAVHHIVGGNPGEEPTCPTWSFFADTTMAWCTAWSGR